MVLKFTLSDDCPSSKNSQMLVQVKKNIIDKKTGIKTQKVYPTIIKSKYCRKWEAMAKYELKQFTSVHSSQIRFFKEQIPYPWIMMVYFYRETRRGFDYNNMTQAVQDLMVKYGLLPDDSANYLLPVPCGWEIDREKPRTEIILTAELFRPEEWKEFKLKWRKEFIDNQLA